MKKAMKGIGWGLLYLLVYLALQAAVTAGYMAVRAVVLVLRHGPEVLENVMALVGSTLSQLAAMVLASNAVFLLVIWLILRLQKKQPLREVRICAIRPGNLAACLLVGVSMPFVLSGLLSLIPFPESMLEDFTAQQGLLFEGNAIVGFVSIVLVGPLAEEVLFRGLIYNSMKTGLRPWLAGGLSALLFGLCHGQSFWILAAFLMGLLMVWCYEKTGSLWGSLAVHAVNNGMAFVEDSLPEMTGAVTLIVTLALAVVLIGAICYLAITNRKIPAEA